MAEASAGSNAFQAVPVFNATIPKEGPKSLPVTCDFSVVPTYDIDLTLIQTQQRMSVVQSVFVDNTLNAQKTTVTINGNSQTLVIPAGGQAYLPLLAARPTIITVASTGGVVVPMIFLNVPVPACVWDTTTSSAPSTPSYVYTNGEQPGIMMVQTVAGVAPGFFGGSIAKAISVDGSGNVNVNVLSTPSSTSSPQNSVLTTVTVSNGDGDVNLTTTPVSPQYLTGVSLTNTDPVNTVIINYNSTGDGASGYLLLANATLEIPAVVAGNNIVAYSSAGGASSNINVSYSVSQ